MAADVPSPARRPPTLLDLRPRLMMPEREEEEKRKRKR
jgi:hypothetical protein